MARDEQESPVKKAKLPSGSLKPALKKSKSTFASEKAARVKPPPAKPKPSRIEEIIPKPKVTVDKGKAVARNSPAKSEKSKSQSSSLPTTFKVVVGTYEKLLYGLEGSFYDEDGNALEKPRLKPIFIFPSHVACVKAVAASPDGGKWLATGSTDEIVKVWDLRRRKEIGGLIQHEGSITHLSFPTRSHLISASEDGTICIFRARDWVLLRSLKGHKGRVNSVAVHPSGKVGLSVGKDRALRMWDLMRGKGSASTKLGKEGELVRWSTKGDLFAVQSGSSLDIYSTDMALLHTVTHPTRVQDIRFCRSVDGESEFLLVAAEDKKVTIYNPSGKDSTSLPIIAELVGHQNRVKAIDTLTIALPQTSSTRTSTTILSTISSDGWIRIFDLGSIPSPTPNEGIPTLTSIAEYDTKGSRLTCCTLADGEAPSADVTGKRKHTDEDEDESGIEDEEMNEQTDGVSSDRGVEEES